MKVLTVTLACLLGLTLTAPAQKPASPGSEQRVEDLLALYGKLIGKNVIYDNRVQGVIPLALTADLPDVKKAELI